jgi:hypothetical protein
MFKINEGGGEDTLGKSFTESFRSGGGQADTLLCYKGVNETGSLFVNVAQSRVQVDP